MYIIHKSLTKHGERIIYSGDFNSHHITWGSKNTSHRGKLISAWVDDNDLVILNDGTHTRIDPSTGNTTAIDLTIVTTKLANQVSWSVGPDTLGSDHLPLYISVNQANAHNDSIEEHKLNTKKANWDHFAYLCENTTKEEIYDEDINIHCANLTNTFYDIAVKTIPRKKNSKSKKHKRVPWWNTECKEAIQERKKALNTLKRKNNETNMKRYRESSQKAKQTILTAKKESWTKFCQTVNSKNTKHFWQQIKRMKGTNFKQTPLLQAKGKIAKTDKDKAELLLKHYQKVSSEENLDKATKLHQEHAEKVFEHPAHHDDKDIINTLFTLQELKDVLNSRKDSAAGPDKLTYTMFKHMPECSLILWLNLYNRIWTKGQYPDDWKTATVVPIAKPNKPQNEPKSYRPISLTSHAGKIMECMVKQRLVFHLESNNLLNVEQAGFRKNRSTIDQIIKLQNDITYAKNTNQKVLAIFLDLQAAFDLAWHTGILTKLKEFGLRGNIYNYIKTFLENRQIQVRVNDQLSEKGNIDRGTPQGSVISPILFNLLINDLPETQKTHGMKVSQFADDNASWVLGRNTRHLINKAQKSLDDVWEWASRWGFKISQDKSEAIIFNTKIQTNTNLMLGNKHIEFKSTVKFLGLHWDRLNTFTHHIDQITTKCQKDMNLMRMLKGTDYGADKQSLLTIYKTIIRPKLDYGCEIFNNLSKNTLQKLDIIQNTALKIALGALKSTPKTALEHEAGILPLSLHMEQKRLMYWARVKANDKNPNNEIFREYYSNSKYDKRRKPVGEHIDKLTQEYKIQEEPIIKVDLIPDWVLLAPNVDLELAQITNKTEDPTIIKQKFLEHKDTNHKHATSIYTDGSKDPKTGKVAAAFTVPSTTTNISFRLSDNRSIYTAEMVAIRGALQWISKNKIADSIIYSDSLSSLQSIKANKSENRPDLLNEIKTVYTECTKLKNLKTALAWCPAHVGISGNEAADKLAKEALKNPNIDHTISASKTEIKSLIHPTLQEKYRYYITSNNPKHSYTKSKFSLRPPTQYNPSYQIDKCITRLRLGSNLLPGHQGQHILGLDKTCNKCQCKLDTTHYLFECVTHSEERQSLLRNLQQNELDPLLENVLDPPGD